MIHLKRTCEDKPDLSTYEDVHVIIEGGFETTVDELLNYFVGFMVLLGYPPDMIIDHMKEYVSQLEE